MFPVIEFARNGLMELLLRARQELCGRIPPGHHFTMELLVASDGYVLDPLIECNHCDKKLPDYLLDEIADVLEDEDEEDEVW